MYLYNSAINDSYAGNVDLPFPKFKPKIKCSLNLKTFKVLQVFRKISRHGYKQELIKPELKHLLQSYYSKKALNVTSIQIL